MSKGKNTIHIFNIQVWISEWLFLMPNKQYFSYIMERTNYIELDKDDVHFGPTHLVGFL